jgi:hypothetical protein
MSNKEMTVSILVQIPMVKMQQSWEISCFYMVKHNKCSGEFQKIRYKDSDGEKFFHTLMYTWHIGVRWYTSDLYFVTRNVLTFVPPWHQGMYAGIGEIGVRCL